MARAFGHIRGIPVGTTYKNHRDLTGAGVHRPHQHGISGAAYTLPGPPAEAAVVIDRFLLGEAAG